MKAYILLAPGFEIIEALTPVDVLRRAKVETITLSITNNFNVTASNNVTVQADALLSEDLPLADVLILPGGFPGYENLGLSKAVANILIRHQQAGKFIAAICGAPTVLDRNDIAVGCTLTGHSSVKDKMHRYNYTGNSVEQDGRIITAIGAGHSLPFAFAILKNLTDEETVNKVKRGMELA